MRIALCLQTADRPDYTARTLATFAAHNDLSRFLKLHGDDASARPDNAELARQYGFKKAIRTKSRVGCLALRTALILAAARKRADWVLILENDIETVRPFPWALFAHVAALPWVWALRLFGTHKGPNGTDPCRVDNQWKPRKPVHWKTLTGAPEPAEYGLIHWSAQPTVTRTAPLVALHTQGIKEMRAQTVRVLTNVMVHIGTTRTRQLDKREAVAC